MFVASDFDATLYAFSSRGYGLPGWPVQLAEPSSGGSLGYPVAASASGEDHIYTSDQWGHIYALGSDGEPLAGTWPVEWPGYQSFAWPAAASDALNGETVYATHSSYSQGDPGGLLHALRRDGAERSGWPVQVGQSAFANGPAVSPDGSIYLLSIESSGRTPFRLHAFAPDGKPKEGWPYEFPAGFGAIYGVAGPAVGSDGIVHLPVFHPPLSDPNAKSLYYAFKPSGAVRTGWPVRIRGGTIGTPSVTDDGTTYLSVWRLTADATRQVAQVSAFDRQGNAKSGWPVRFAAPYSGPSDVRAVAGIIVDAVGDVFFALRDQVHGYDPNGRSLPGWPVRVEDADLYWPVLASDNRIYVTSREDENRVYALEAGTAATPATRRSVTSSRRPRLIGNSPASAGPSGGANMASLGVFGLPLRGEAVRLLLGPDRGR